MFSTIIQPQAQQMASLCWRRLVRYTTKDGGVVSEPKYGDVWETPPTADLGLLAEQGRLSVRALTVGLMGPLNDTVEFTSQDTNTVEKVHRLLSPLAERDVPLFRCIGLNYKTHISPISPKVLEAGRTLPPYPSQFIKPSTSIADYGDDVPIPKCAQDPPEADYEGELCVVIGKRCRDVEPKEAMNFVAGYTIGNDVSTRKWQRDKERAGGVPQWCFSKGFDKFAPLGPCLVNVELIDDPAKQRLTTRINGEERQDTSISDLVFDVPALVSFLSKGTTLSVGTVIMTGTPGGVGCAGSQERWRPLRSGDKVEIEISSVGVLRHGITYE